MNARLGAPVCMYVCKDMQGGGWERGSVTVTVTEATNANIILHFCIAAARLSQSLSLSLSLASKRKLERAARLPPESAVESSGT